MTYIGEAIKYDQGSPISFWINQDSGDTTRYVPFISQSGTSLPDRDYYLKDDENMKKLRAQNAASLAWKKYQSGV